MIVLGGAVMDDIKSDIIELLDKMDPDALYVLYGIIISMAEEG